MHAIADQLSNKAACEASRATQDDYYFRVESDTRKVPGTVVHVCTMWLAQCTSRPRDDGGP